MHLDPATLLIVSSVTTLLVGTLFLSSWRQAPASRALAIWGVAHIVGAFGSGGLALRGQIPDLLSIGLANAVVLAAYGLIWSGVRSFEGRPLRLGTALAASLIWCGLCLVPAFYESITARIVYASAAATFYCGDAAVVFWRGRRERLASRVAAGTMLGLHAAFYLVRIPSTLLAPPQRAVPRRTMEPPGTSPNSVIPIKAGPPERTVSPPSSGHPASAAAAPSPAEKPASQSSVQSSGSARVSRKPRGTAPLAAMSDRLTPSALRAIEAGGSSGK